MSELAAERNNVIHLILVNSYIVLWKERRGKKWKNELNEKKELEALAIAIKEVYFQDYTTVYDDSHTEIDKPQFDYII